ncbi:MAG: tRNA (adenosine(37)-N6)-threonylcarbamoyltransferase complex ATPase subunit type 1 TsaE [Acidobacteriota bacterium]|nr:tRNA (adenosine(37)-N6)-threonylcarbamoyltransferase complex ATPase subunit type 1 TsaE [Acidobacteriota bacterium]
MSTTSLTWTSTDEPQTELAGEALARHLVGGEVLSLTGTLGAGKTVFVRGLARGLGLPGEPVCSPSFVLATLHEGRPGLLHVDLYRLADGAGIDDLGIEEAMEERHVVAVEWGERLPAWLAPHAWRIRIELEGDVRRITADPPRKDYSRR